MKTLSVKIADELSYKLATVSKQRGVSKAKVVEEALEAFLSDKNGRPPVSCLDLAGDLVGCLEGPEDLATNPEHMEGFGR